VCVCVCLCLWDYIRIAKSVYVCGIRIVNSLQDQAHLRDTLQDT
jgi:hypothetical protein